MLYALNSTIEKSNSVVVWDALNSYIAISAGPFFVTSFDADNMSRRRVKFACHSSVTHHANDAISLKKETSASAL